MARGKPCLGPLATRADSSAATDGPARRTGGSESLDGRKTMASLFASSREHLAAPFGLHARAKPMRLVATAHLRLKRAFRQRTLPLGTNIWTDSKRLV